MRLADVMHGLVDQLLNKVVIVLKKMCLVIVVQGLLQIEL